MLHGSGLFYLCCSPLLPCALSATTGFARSRGRTRIAWCGGASLDANRCARCERASAKPLAEHLHTPRGPANHLEAMIVPLDANSLNAELLLPIVRLLVYIKMCSPTTEYYTTLCLLSFYLHSYLSSNNSKCHLHLRCTKALPKPSR